MAEQDLLEAESRDDVLGAYFDFVSQYFEYSALFAVHGDLAEGRDADGPGTGASRIRRIGVPLDLPGALATARERGSWQIAPLADDGIDKSLAKDLQRATRRAVLVLPVVVRGRAVLMLYGDHGGIDVSLTEIGDVLSFTPLVVAALERLILRRKLAASGADPTPSVSLPPVQRKVRHQLPPPEQRAGALTRAIAGEVSTGEPPSTDEASPAAKRRSDGPAPETVAATPAAFVQEQAPSTSSESPAAKARTEAVASRPVVAVGVRRNTPTHGTPRQIEDEDEQPIPLTRRTPPPPAPPVFVDDEEPPEDGWDVEESDLERSPVPTDSDEHAALVAQYKSVDSDTGVTQRLGEVPLAPASHKVAYGPVQPRKRHSSPGLRLPSVIVDLEADCIALVKRMNDGDQSAQDQLVEIGEAAIPVLTSRFPGPVRPELARRVGEPGARASQCGPILHTLVRLGDAASPFLVVRTADRDPDVRRWATWLLGEMPSSDTARAVARRVVDDSADVRRAAIAAGRLMQEDVDARTALRDTLASLAADTTQPESSRNAAIEALADIRDGRAVPRLIPLLRDEASAVAKSARWALEILTRQRLGRDAKDWQEWWKDHGKRHRIEWLIEALDDDDAELRRDAGDELKTVTKEYFGFYEDLAPKERRKVQRKYREWWEEKGKARFF